ncbi:CAP domain-containing protein [Kineosporia babensis]|uniref:CAP domain-containing protein n=1 Tax=Kineosporia babensis TaxID=499548 RepID=A0A9X1NJ96_9ACTN|nr:CAP domain-containing protein [Kineosporia babensis]MCD5315095.1 CAP domain-containing protein [Kineosporia babensis]
MPKRAKPRSGRKRPPDRPSGPPTRRSLPTEEPDTWAPATVQVRIEKGSATGQARRRHLEDQVLRLVNAARQRAGSPPLKADERLRAAARQHSERMSDLQFFDHMDPDGSDPGQRMLAAGHPAPGAENIAAGQAAAEPVMQAWMNSPGHRVNILNPAFVSLGVGVDLRPGGPFWTQNFGY